MLDLLGPTFQNCDRITRREVLRVGSLAAGGATLADFLKRKARGSAAGPLGLATEQATEHGRQSLPERKAVEQPSTAALEEQVTAGEHCAADSSHAVAGR